MTGNYSVNYSELRRPNLQAVEEDPDEMDSSNRNASNSKKGVPTMEDLIEEAKDSDYTINRDRAKSGHKQVDARFSTNTDTEFMPVQFVDDNNEDQLKLTGSHRRNATSFVNMRPTTGNMS